MNKMVTIEIRSFLRQYKDEAPIRADELYKLVTISNKGVISLREKKEGINIKSDKAYRVKRGLFIYSRLAAHTGAFGLVPPELDGAVVTNEMPVFEINREIILPDYMVYLFRQKSFLNTLYQLTKGMGRVRIKEDSFLQQRVTIHNNVSDQKKVIDSIDSRFKKIDTLNSTHLEQVDYLKNLRQAVLQEAIEGKLTAEWRKDNPERISGENHASKLFEIIRAEKNRLIEEGKIRKEKPLPPITDIEKPFTLPSGWVWCRLQDITKVITCGIASTPKYYSEGRMFLSAKNIKPYRFMPEDHKYVDEKTYKLITNNAKPEKGDILMTRVGAGIGESAIVDQNIDFAYYVSLTLIKMFHDFLSSQYMLHFLNSPHGIKNAVSYTTGVGSSQGNLNVNRVRPYVIPLPSLFEQNVIVERVNKVMALIDDLERQMDDRKERTELLMQSVLREAFSKSE